MGNSEGSGAKSYMTNGLLIYGENICAFLHILGSPSSYMTLHPIPSEFPYIWGKLCFLFYQYRVNRRKRILPLWFPIALYAHSTTICSKALFVHLYIFLALRINILGSVLPDWFIGIPVLPVRTQPRGNRVNQGPHLQNRVYSQGQQSQEGTQIYRRARNIRWQEVRLDFYERWRILY